MELFWDRGSKKANAVFCHPKLHNLLDDDKVSKGGLYSAWRRSNIDFPPRLLRKVNFTNNAQVLDPMLAEFMQGRRGSVSLRHYYLPTMEEIYEK